MLHADDAGEALVVDVAEDVLVVDLAGGGLVAAGVVASLEVSDLVPGTVDVGDEVALGDLLVVEVVEDLARGAADSAADHVGLGDLGKEELRVVAPVVQGFEDHHQARGLADLGAALEYGYEAKPLRDSAGRWAPSTKALSMITCWGATALLALHTGTYTTSKDEVIYLYGELIADEWTDLLVAVDRLCRRDLSYAIPPEEDARARLRALAERVLRFENHLLTTFRTREKTGA